MTYYLVWWKERGGDGMLYYSANLLNEDGTYVEGFWIRSTNSISGLIKQTNEKGYRKLQLVNDSDFWERAQRATQ